MFLAAIMAIAAGATVAAPQASINDLGWLIGRWTFEDRATEEVGSDYVETGARDCQWALDKRYIRCESIGVSNGKTRTYVSYINYNSDAGRFEMLSMWGNVPHKAIDVLHVSADGRTIERVGEPYEEDGRRWRPWSVISYDGADSYVWESGRRREEPGAERGPVRYRDTVVRAD